MELALTPLEPSPGLQQIICTVSMHTRVFMPAYRKIVIKLVYQLVRSEVQFMYHKGPFVIFGLEAVSQLL